MSAYLNLSLSSASESLITDYTMSSGTNNRFVEERAGHYDKERLAGRLTAINPLELSILDRLAEEKANEQINSCLQSIKTQKRIIGLKIVGILLFGATACCIIAIWKSALLINLNATKFGAGLLLLGKGIELVESYQDLVCKRRVLSDLKVSAEFLIDEIKAHKEMSQEKIGLHEMGIAV